MHRNPRSFRDDAIVPQPAVHPHRADRQGYRPLGAEGAGGLRRDGSDRVCQDRCRRASRQRCPRCRGFRRQDAPQGRQRRRRVGSGLTDIAINAGPYAFTARFEREAAPLTCACFESLLPYRERLIHVRWSGEACWIPLGTLDLGLGYENATSFPAPGQILLYPGGISETEILLAYGAVRFASKVGQLAGNHFLTIVEGLDQLRPLGELVLWSGAQDIEFARL